VPDPILPATPPPVVIRRSSNEETFLTTTAISPLPQPLGATDARFDLSRQTAGAAPESPKKRNVNWHTPIQIYATYERAEQPCCSRDACEDGAEADGESSVVSVKPAYQSRRNIGEDDGFERLDGSDYEQRGLQLHL